MDCRTFRKNLEDYLEDGLDFAGRFGMERHAQQCIGCGKEMADAQRIRRMVPGLERVKAPESFEALVINEIAKRKLNARAGGIRRFWAYGHEGALWRKLALASSGLAVLAVGVLVFFNQTVPRQDIDTSVALEEPVKPDAAVDAIQSAGMSAAAPSLRENSGEEALKAAAAPKELKISIEEPVPEWNATDAEYVDHMIRGVDGRTIQLPLPKKLHFRYSQMSEEYFIQNVSH